MVSMQSFSLGKQDMHIGLALLHYPLALVSVQSFSFGKQDMHMKVHITKAENQRHAQSRVCNMKVHITKA